MFNSDDAPTSSELESEELHGEAFDAYHRANSLCLGEDLEPADFNDNADMARLGRFFRTVYQSNFVEFHGCSWFDTVPSSGLHAEAFENYKASSAIDLGDTLRASDFNRSADMKKLGEFFRTIYQDFYGNVTGEEWHDAYDSRFGANLPEIKYL